jgi:hypothetical protein
MIVHWAEALVGWSQAFRKLWKSVDVVVVVGLVAVGLAVVIYLIVAYSSSPPTPPPFG